MCDDYSVMEDIEQANKEREQQLAYALMEAFSKDVSEESLKIICFECGVSYKNFRKD